MVKNYRFHYKAMQSQDDIFKIGFRKENNK